MLAADTVVVQRGVLLAKPADAGEARAMLARLRGRPHRVDHRRLPLLHRAVAGRRIAHAVTSVLMRRYAPDEIEASIARGDPFDKAGAYAIQDPVFSPVASLRRLLLQRRRPTAVDHAAAPRRSGHTAGSTRPYAPRVRCLRNKTATFARLTLRFSARNVR